MIGPVSGTGRAMMASLQQAIQKGMPPDQAIQYVKSMATQGVAPLTDLYSMMNQFQRLKQQQVKPPQTPPTIRDELNMMDQQQQMQQAMAQQGNIQQMQAPPPPGQPMDRGLGAVDAGLMEYPKFSGGGITALAGGGDVIAFQNEGLVPKPYEFNDDLSSRVPSFMTSDMDIVSFVKRQMPNFDMLTPEQKQQVLRSFEPAYNRARAARLKLEGRGAVETAAPDAAPVAAPAPAGQQLNFRNQNALMSVSSPFDSPDKQMGDVFSQLSTRPAEAPTVTEERRPAAPRREVATAPKEDIFTRFERTAPNLETVRKERLERQRTAKTGEFSQADADLAAYIKEQKEKGGDTKEAYRNFWVMTGASLMANKSPNFLQALGESVKENYGGLVKDLKQLKDDTKALRLQEIQLRRAQEQAIESGSTADQERVDRLTEKAEATNLSIAGKRSDIYQKALDRDNDRVLAQLRQYGNEKAIEKLNRMYENAIAIQDPMERERSLAAYHEYREEVRKNTIASTAGGVAAEIRADVAGQTRLANLAKNDSIYRNAQRVVQSSQDPQEVQRAQELIRIKEQQALGAMAAGPRVVQDEGLTGGAYTGPYSTSGW